MICQDARQLLHGYLDGELDLVRSLEMESHIAICPDCERAYESLQTLRKSLQKSDLYFRAPSSLSTRLRPGLRRMHAFAEPAHRPRWQWRWAAAAAVVVLATAGTVWVSLSSRRSANDLLAQEAVSAHIRSLMANHLTDVASTDQHTVKPWFAGRLDFSPPVIDLAQEGFPLVGGRLDYLNGRPVAALVYARRKHLINIFVWPAQKPSAAPARLAAPSGFNLFHWTQGGMEWWAASDLNAGELGQLTQMLHARIGSP